MINYFNKIKSDESIMAIYRKIHEYEDAECGYAYHDYNHVNNLEKLNNYYFTKKVFKAIQSFSDKLNLSPKVMINNKLWEEFYK